MTSMRSSMDRLGMTTAASEDEMTVLKRRALIERGIAVVDLGKVRNADWAFVTWLRSEVARQLDLDRKRAR